MSVACRNLKFLRKEKGWTQAEFAARLGIKRSLLGAYEEERATPRTEVLEIVSDMFRLSLDELLRKDLAAPEESFLQKRRNIKNAERQTIEFVPVKAAAGYLSGYNDEEFIEELNTFTLPMLGAGNYRAFEIAGDSMLPVEPGAVIVGHKIEGWEDIRNNQPYVILMKRDGIVYKRVLKSNRNKNKLTLVSDNPQYEPYPVLLEEVLEIWQADAVINKVSSNPRMSVNHLADIVNHLQEQVSVLRKKVR
jgi:transcriptional regulator with XRE-family HTH domain